MTSSLFRLPDWLGGREADLIAEKPGGIVTVHARVGEDAANIDLRRDLLVEVEPPLPPVPDVLAVAVGDHVFMRDNLGGEPCFICPGSCHRHPLDWEELHVYAAEQGKPIVSLVPDPVQDAPELPWTLGDHKDRIGVTDNNLVWIYLKPDYHSPEEAELRACAILRAAREARQS